MQTLLVLYMTRQLLLPGHVENIAGMGWFRRLMEVAYNGGDTLSVWYSASHFSRPCTCFGLARMHLPCAS